MSYNPVKCRENALNEIAEAEADIAQCMADFICCILDELKTDHKHSVEEKIELFRCLILASAVKEKAIASVINALANIILAKKGPCDGFNDCAEED